jgi:hypothetical protein
MDKREAGERQREAKARYARGVASESREIGPLPKVRNPRRRARGKRSLERFGLDYFPSRFFLPFSGMHRSVIDQLELVTNEGGLSCVAMPRGSGKTALAEVAALRALLYGMRRFLVLIGATSLHAARILKRLKTELETNDLLLEDFPEAVYPIRRLERNPKRAAMQTLNGQPTLIEWTSEGVVFPTVPGAACSGAAVQVAGLTGAIRGLSVLGPDGQPVRPDLVLLDDVQTRDSAKSPTQTADREAIVSDDVLMLAGPTTRIAAVNLCTVVYPNDLSDRFLDAEKHPDWERVRTKTVERMPDRLDLWDRYAELRREGRVSGAGVGESDAFLTANWDEMHRGAVVSWPERVKDGDRSALQTAMHVYYFNPRGFHAEMQNEPQVEMLGSGIKELRAEDVAHRDRLSGVDALVVPGEATRLTAGFDVGGELCWYAVVAWDERFTGWVVDYGCWPRQNRAVFESRDARPGLSDVYPRLNESQRVVRGLSDLTDQVRHRPYRRSTGGELRIERGLADRGWQPDAVTAVVRRHPGLLYPSVGIGRTTNRTGVSEWKRRPGERSGYHWRLTVGEDRKRMVQFDPDAWKTFIWERLTTAPGGAGALLLPGRTATTHALLGEHCAAEYGEPVTIRGQTFDKWTVRPSNPDNHLFDVLVLAAVAASVAGVRWEPGLAPTAPPPERQAKPAVDFAELVRRNRAAKAGR